MFGMRSIVIVIIFSSMGLTLPGMLLRPPELSDYASPEVCSGCHAEIYLQWNDSMHSMSYEDPVYQQLFIMTNMETNSTFGESCTGCHVPIDYLAYSEPHSKSEFCGKCHGKRHLFNVPVLENTYTEWKEGPYNETTACQDCHMHDKLGRERLQAAVQLDIVGLEMNNGTVNLTVMVKNVGAGHKIPTGFTEARKMWLDIDVRDSKDRQIFRSGAMDREGHIDESARIFHTILSDANGMPAEKVWLADRILLDKRIPPKGYSIENYTFKVLANANGPLNITITLNYIPLSQGLSDVLFGKGEMKPQVIKMAAANTTLGIPPTKRMPGFSPELFLIAILILFRLTKYSYR